MTRQSFVSHSLIIPRDNGRWRRLHHGHDQRLEQQGEAAAPAAPRNFTLAALALPSVQTRGTRAIE